MVLSVKKHFHTIERLLSVYIFQCICWMAIPLGEGAFHVAELPRDEQGIRVLHIREADQLVDRGIISAFPLQVGVRRAPIRGHDMATFSASARWRKSP